MTNTSIDSTHSNSSGTNFSLPYSSMDQSRHGYDHAHKQSKGFSTFESRKSEYRGESYGNNSNDVQKPFFNSNSVGMPSDGFRMGGKETPRTETGRRPLGMELNTRMNTNSFENWNKSVHSTQVPDRSQHDTQFQERTNSANRTDMRGDLTSQTKRILPSDMEIEEGEEVVSESPSSELCCAIHPPLLSRPPPFPAHLAVKAVVVATVAVGSVEPVHTSTDGDSVSSGIDSDPAPDTASWTQDPVPASTDSLPSTAVLTTRATSLAVIIPKLLPSSTTCFTTDEVCSVLQTEMTAATDYVLLVTDTVLPATDTVLPSTDTVLPSTDAVVLATDNVLSAVLPSTDTVLLASDTVLPSTDTVLPATDTVLPASDTVLPDVPFIAASCTEPNISSPLPLSAEPSSPVLAAMPLQQSTGEKSSAKKRMASKAVSLTTSTVQPMSTSTAVPGPFVLGDMIPVAVAESTHQPTDTPMEVTEGAPTAAQATPPVAVLPAICHTLSEQPAAPLAAVTAEASPSDPTPAAALIPTPTPSRGFVSRYSKTETGEYRSVEPGVQGPPSSSSSSASTLALSAVHTKSVSMLSTSRPTTSSIPGRVSPRLSQSAQKNVIPAAVTVTVRTIELPTSKRKREKEKEEEEVIQSMPLRNPRHNKESISVSQEKKEKVKEKESDLPAEPKKPRTWGDHSVAINVMRSLVVRPSEPEKLVKPVSLCSKVNYIQPPPRVCVVGVTSSSSESCGRGNQSHHHSSTAHTRASTVGVQDASPVKGSPSRRAPDGRRGSDSGGRNTSSSRGNGKSNNRDRKKKEVPMPSRRSSR